LHHFSGLAAPFVRPTRTVSGGVFTIDHEAHPVFAQVVAAFGDEWVGTPEPKSTLPTSTATVWEESFWSVINGINTPEEAAQSVQDELETELG